MKIKITADSTCDLSEALLRQWDISLMPMHILMGGESYLDGITVRPADVFAHVEAGGQTPKSTAATSPPARRESKNTTTVGIPLWLPTASVISAEVYAPAAIKPACPNAS